MRVTHLTVVLILIFGTITFSHAQVKRPTPEPILIRQESGTLKHIKGTPGRIPQVFEIGVDANSYDWGRLEFNFKLGDGTCRASFGFSKDYEERGVADRVAIAPGSNFKLDRTYEISEIRKKNKIYVYVADYYIPLFDDDCDNTYEFTVYLTNYQRYIPPAPYPGTLGGPDYYDFRHKDFIRRNPGRTPPDYYKDFGEKYFNTFVTEIFPTLSSEGQEFLKLVGKALQQKIEDKLKADPRAFAGLERLSDRFRTFAYFTHPDAYCESGWERLSQSDKDKIIGAISWQDKYLSWRAAFTAGKIMYKCGGFLEK